MNMHMKFVRVVAVAVAGFCVQPIVSSAVAQQGLAIDSVNTHVRAHPKPRKASVAPVAAKASPGATSAKAKRQAPSLILPASQQPMTPATARKATVSTADSVPAVRRAAMVPKSAAKRK